MNEIIVICRKDVKLHYSLKEDSKPITRTINYVVDDGQAPDIVIQTVILTRHGSKNLVTGEIT